jgi:PAS domain S-box-containing protein
LAQLYGPRLSLVAIIGAVPLSVVSLVLIGRSYDGRIAFSMQEQRGNLFQRPVEQLLDLVPRYQAAMAQVAAGAGPARADSAALARQIESALDALTVNYETRLGGALKFSDADLAASKRDQARLTVVTSSWKALLAAPPPVAAKGEIAGQLVNSLRAMIAQVGDRSNLILDDNLDSYYLMDITVNALPRVQERLGETTLQVGGWLRDGTVSLHRPDIAPLALRLQDNMDRVRNDADVSVRENGSAYGVSESLHANLPPAVSSYLAAQKAFSDLIDRILAGGSVSPTEFEAAGWSARAQSFKLWQISADELDRLLATRIGALRRERLRAFEVVLATVGLAALAIAWIIHGLLRATYVQTMKANEELSAKEARLRAIGDRLPDSVVYQTIREADGTVRFLYVSAGIERINGLSVPDVLRDYSLIYNQILEEDRPKILAARAESARSMSVFDVEVRSRRTDGEVRWIRLSAAPRPLPDGRIIWDGIERDITERKRTEAALRESEEKFARVFQASPDAIVITDLQTGEILEANPNYERLFGYARAEIVGRTSVELGIFASAAERQPMLEVLSADGGIRDWEMVAYNRQGNPIPLLFSGELINLNNRTCLVAVIHDITRRKQAEARERQTRDEFTRKLLSSQEAERRRIALELHDSLGQNLILIKNRCQLALETPAVPPAVHAQLQILRDMSAQALAEVRQISHDLRPHQLDHLGLTRALEAMIEGVGQSSKLPIERRLDPVDDLFTPEAATHLFRVAQETISNVLKHARARRVRIGLERDMREVRLWIQDDGQGFAPAPAQPGPTSAGLGLSSIAERVRIVGGVLRVESNPGQGTRIEVVIPHSGVT